MKRWSNVGEVNVPVLTRDAVVMIRNLVCFSSHQWVHAISFPPPPLHPVLCEICKLTNPV